jgi:hypothetical protein
MRLGSLASRAKELIDKRGGTESLKQDAEELRDIARSRGSFSDKAKRAAEAVKDPGASPRAEYDPAAGPAHAEPSPERAAAERGSQPSETARRRERRERRARRARR